MSAWWEDKIGMCYREQGIACAEGTCGHCDGAKAMTQWMVRYVGKIVPVIIEAPTFMEAVTKAVEYAKEYKLGNDPIISVSYLAY
jgi:hypothetical protein